MSSITTHVLDTALGHPAAGVAITLAHLDQSTWHQLGAGTTDADGRLRTLLPGGHALRQGHYRITFAVGAYHASQGQAGFFPEVTLDFLVGDPTQHYHVPLLLSPFGFSTYRGS